MELLIVSGLSGAGKSVAMNALEDIGFFCIDNVPAGLLPSITAFSEAGECGGASCVGEPEISTRFRYIEKSLQDRGKSLSESSLPEMESLWEEAKALEKAKKDEKK